MNRFNVLIERRDNLIDRIIITDKKQVHTRPQTNDDVVAEFYSTSLADLVCKFLNERLK